MSKEYYECFSKRLNGYLTYRGLDEMYCYKHNKTGVLCHVYKITPELIAILKDWSAKKNLVK